MATTLASQVQELYIGYLGRAADKAGLDFWVKAIENGTSTLESVALGFTLSAEYKAAYEGLTTTQLVARVYQNVLGRAADADGLAFWVGEINKGVVKADTLVKSMINSLGAIDQLNMDNKVQSANTYTTTAGDKYDLAAAKAAIGASTSNNPGQTFTLTTNVDNVVGTSGNDTIIGGVGSAGGNSTLGSADVINGGAGTDTLKLTTEGAVAVAATPNLTAVEKIEVQALGTAGTTVNLVNATGVQEIWNVRSTDALTVTNVQEAATVGLKGNVGANAYRVGFKDSLASGTADSVNIALEDAVTTGGLGLGGMTVANEFETINIAATGTNSINQLQQSGGAALAATKTVNVTGAGKLTVTNALAATVTEVNASANTGGVSFDLTATGAVKATGGAGSDTFNMGGSLTTADVLVGGDGTDIIGITAGATLVNGLQVSGFETLDIGGAGGNTNAFDVSKLSGITTLKVGTATAVGNAVTVNNLAKGAGVEVNAALGNQLNINVKDAGAGSPNDSIAVLVKGATAITTGSILDINDIETVTLTADKATATGAVTHTISTLTADEALTVKVANGNAALTITDLNAKALVLFDATEATQAVSVTTVGGTAFVATNGVAFKLGQAADTLELTGSTTAGGDFFITGGAGGDKITLTANNNDAVAGTGEEIEVLVYTAAADSQVGKTAAGATKYDVITNFDTTGAVGTAFDKIDLKALNIASGQQSVFVKAPGTAITDSGEVAAADQLNFFVNAGSKNGVAVVTAADVDGNTAAAQAGVFVYVDANGDGNFSAADDMVIALVGATAANIGANTFVFA